MAAEWAVVVWGLLSAASWGAGDFSGGLATRRAHVFIVNLCSKWVGFALFVGLALVWGEAWPSTASLAWAVAGGVAGTVGLTFLYRALAVGQMGVAAPITAVLAAGVPVLVGAAIEGRPELVQLFGFALALVGVWFISRAETAGSVPSGLALALVAGLGLGGYLAFMSRAGAEGGVFWPLAIASAVAGLVLLVLVLIQRPAWGAAHRALPIMLLAGMLDSGGNLFYVLASQVGRLDVAAVLASLYPASTVLLARIVLNERLSRPQWVGVLVVLAAVVLISL